MIHLHLLVQLVFLGQNARLLLKADREGEIGGIVANAATSACYSYYCCGVFFT